VTFLPSVYLYHILFERTVAGEKYPERLNIYAMTALQKHCENFGDLYFQQNGVKALE
jgi:hypothetical protein